MCVLLDTPRNDHVHMAAQDRRPRPPKRLDTVLMYEDRYTAAILGDKASQSEDMVKMGVCDDDPSNVVV